MCEVKMRCWYFTVDDHDGATEYIDVDGDITDETDERTNPFKGTSVEAAVEADRRADLFEEKKNCLVAKITYHSLGILKDANR